MSSRLRFFNIASEEHVREHRILSKADRSQCKPYIMTDDGDILATYRVLDTLISRHEGERWYSEEVELVDGSSDAEYCFQDTDMRAAKRGDLVQYRLGSIRFTAINPNR